MMTKEEILAKHHPKPGGVYDAMDEYAKRFGENLIGWLNDNEFKFTAFKDNMQSGYMNNGQRMHVSEIIDKFIKQK